jgi:hypothetical protein
MPTVEIICLANSRKHSGRCVAGLRTDGQGWIRPVGPSDNGTLFPWHYTLADGTEPHLLDILRIELDSHQPKSHQPEDWRIAEKTAWQLLFRPAPVFCRLLLRSAVVRGPDLLGNQSDRIPFGAFATTPAGASLALILPKDLLWDVRNKDGGKRQVRARFRLGAAPYNLAVTDPHWEKRLDTLRPGIHPATAASLEPDDTILLTISLGEPFSGECYKLAAAVIVLPSSWKKE